jgi:hypothetical protein
MSSWRGSVQELQTQLTEIFDISFYLSSAMNYKKIIFENKAEKDIRKEIIDSQGWRIVNEE